MNQEHAIFKSQVNGITFDSVNPTTNMLLNSHAKSQFVQPLKVEHAKQTKNGKAKISVGEDGEQEIR